MSYTIFLCMINIYGCASLKKPHQFDIKFHMSPESQFAVIRHENDYNLVLKTNCLKDTDASVRQNIFLYIY